MSPRAASCTCWAARASCSSTGPSSAPTCSASLPHVSPLSEPQFSEQAQALLQARLPRALPRVPLFSFFVFLSNSSFFRRWLARESPLPCSFTFFSFLFPCFLAVAVRNMHLLSLLHAASFFVFFVLLERPIAWADVPAEKEKLFVQPRRRERIAPYFRQARRSTRAHADAYVCTHMPAT